MSDRRPIVLAERVIYDAQGRAIQPDERDAFQQHWDKTFRNDLSLRGPLHQAVMEAIKRRDRDRADELAKQALDEGKLGPAQQDISDKYDEALDARKSREHPKIYSISRPDGGSDQ